MPDDLKYTEDEILRRTANSDQQAFAIVVEKYSAIVYTHILSYIKNVPRAEELTQDVFVNVWKHRQELTTIKNFRGYLHVLTRNRTISALRERLQHYQETEKDELATPELNPADRLEYRQLSETLRHAIEQLPPRRKEIFIMSRFEKKTYDEIAGHVQISKSAVNKHIIEALVFLRTFLKDHSDVMVFLISLQLLFAK